MSDSSQGDEARRALAADFERHVLELMCGSGDLTAPEIYRFAQFAMDNRGAILTALRADPVRAVEEMRTKVEDALTEWTRPSAIRLMVGEMMTAQEGRTANAVAAMLAAKVRAALPIQPAADGGADE